MRQPARSDETTGDETTGFIAASATATVVDTLSNVVPTWPVGRRSRSDHRRPSGCKERSMKIAVVGAGGVGGGYGAALAKAGADVTFIARGAHLAAMKSKGLKARKPARRHPSRADPGDRRSENRGPGRYRAVLRETVGRRERRRGDQADGGRGYRRDPAAERRRCRRPAGADPGPAGGDGRRRQHQRHHRRARRDPPDRHGPAHGVRRARRHQERRAAKRSPPSAPRPASTACCRRRSRPSSG